MLSFYGMNIPTMLYELNTDFDSRLMYDMYKSHEVKTRKGDWTDRQWHEYSQQCLHYHMTCIPTLFGPSRKVERNDEEGNMVIVKTYQSDSIEEN